MRRVCVCARARAVEGGGGYRGSFITNMSKLRRKLLSRLSMGCQGGVVGVGVGVGVCVLLLVGCFRYTRTAVTSPARRLKIKCGRVRPASGLDKAREARSRVGRSFCGRVASRCALWRGASLGFRAGWVLEERCLDFVVVANSRSEKDTPTIHCFFFVGRVGDEQEVVLQAKMLGLANGGPGEPDSAAGFLSQVHTLLCPPPFLPRYILCPPPPLLPFAQVHDVLPSAASINSGGAGIPPPVYVRHERALPALHSKKKSECTLKSASCPSARLLWSLFDLRLTLEPTGKFRASALVLLLRKYYHHEMAVVSG